MRSGQVRRRWRGLGVLETRPAYIAGGRDRVLADDAVLLLPYDLMPLGVSLSFVGYPRGSNHHPLRLLRQVSRVGSAVLILLLTSPWLLAVEVLLCGLRKPSQMLLHLVGPQPVSLCLCRVFACPGHSGA